MESVLNLATMGLETWEQALQITPDGVERVNYAHNRLRDPIPTGKFASLRYLCLRTNGITSISGWTFPETLEELDLTDNAISSLFGASFPSQLQRLRMENNDVDSLDGVVFPGSLEYLGLDRNNIRSLREYTFPPDITSLSLRSNSIEDVAGCVFPANANNIGLDHNRITDIRDCRLPSVVYKLNLVGNRIRSIRGCDLGRISVLYLAGNCLSSWYDLGELPGTMVTLSVSNNFRFCVTSSFTKQLQKYHKARRLYHFYIVLKVARKWRIHTTVA